MTRHPWAVVFFLGATQLVAAPVPPARPVSAETLIKPLQGTPRDLATKLTSASFALGVVRSKGAVALGCLAGQKDATAWLTARLRTSVDEKRGTVTVRLVDCPRPDAVALLTAVVEAYKNDVIGHGHVSLNAQYERVVLFQAIAAAQQPNAGGGMPINITFDMALEPAGPSKAEVDRSVLQAPRVLPPPVFGQGTPGR